MINKDLRPSKVTEIDMMKDLRERVCRLELHRLPVPSTQSYQDPDSDYLNLPDMTPTYQFARQNRMAPPVPPHRYYSLNDP